jgi:spore maturation protein SpmB
MVYHRFVNLALKGGSMCVTKVLPSLVSQPWKFQVEKINISLFLVLHSYVLEPVVNNVSLFLRFVRKV